jgi:hypothetical protein
MPALPQPLIRGLQALLLLSLVQQASAQVSPVPRTTQVTYLSGSSIYIGAGRLDGIAEGDTVEVIRGAAPVAALRVLYLSSRQSSCVRLSGVEEIVVGDSIRYAARALPGDTAPAPTYATRARRLDGTAIHGRIGARYLAAWESEGDAGFHQPSLDLRLDGARLGGSDLGLVLDLRTRRTTSSRADGSTTVDGRTRLYQATLRWRQPGEGLRVALGRQYLAAVTSVSLFDGALVEMGRRHLTIGVFGGTEPEPQDLAFSREVQDLGAYVQWHQAPDQPQVWGISTGVVGSYQDGVTNREFAFLQANVNTRAWSFYGLQELDYYRPWKVAQGEPSVSLTSTYLSSALRPVGWLALNLAYDSRRSVRLYRDAVSPETRFDDAYRTGWWGGVSLRSRRLRLSGDVRLSDGGAAGSAKAYGGSFGLDRVTPLHVNLTGRVTAFRSEASHGSIVSGRLGLTPVAAVHLDVTLGVRSEDVPLADPSHRRITWSAIDADVSLARAWYLTLSGQQEQTPEGRLSQVYAGLSWRF